MKFPNTVHHHLSLSDYLAIKGARASLANTFSRLPPLQPAVVWDAGSEGHHLNSRQSDWKSALLPDVGLLRQQLTSSSPPGLAAQVISLIQWNSEETLETRAVISSCQELFLFLKFSNVDVKRFDTHCNTALHVLFDNHLVTTPTRTGQAQGRLVCSPARILAFFNTLSFDSS